MPHRLGYVFLNVLHLRASVQHMHQLQLGALAQLPLAGVDDVYRPEVMDAAVSGIVKFSCALLSALS